MSLGRGGVHRRTRRFLAGVPGLEPRLTEPETVGLPITPYPMGGTSRRRRRPYPTVGRASPPTPGGGASRRRDREGATRRPEVERRGVRLGPQAAARAGHHAHVG